MYEYKITAPDNAEYKITSPRELTSDEALAYLQQNISPSPAAKTAPVAPKPMFDDVSGLAANALQGFSAGAGGDVLSNVIGAAQAVGQPGNYMDNWQGNYKNLANAFREERGLYNEQNPYKAMAAEVAGGVPLAMATSGALSPAKTLPSRMGQAAALSAPMGFLSGFYEKPQDMSSRIESGVDRAKDYALFGAAVPPVLETGANIAKGAYGATKGALTSAFNAAQSQANPEMTALKKIGQAAILDGQSADALFNAMRNNNLSIAEAGGKNIEAMADAFAQSPGEARPAIANMLANRLATQRENFTDQVFNALDTTGENVNAILNKQAASARIAELAKEAFSDNSPFPMDGGLQNLITNPNVQIGAKEGLSLIRNELNAKGLPFNPADYNATLDEAGNVVFSGQPNIKILDAAKRGLNKLINDNSDEFGRVNDTGRTLTMLKDGLVDRMKAASPNYEKYLNSAADEFALQNATKKGQGLWYTPTNSKNETITQLSRLNPAEKQSALDGAARSFIDAMEKSPDNINVARTKLNSPFYRDILKTLVPDDSSVDNLVKNLQEQSDLFAKNSRWLNQSSTALRTEYGKENNELPGVIKSMISSALNNADEVKAKQVGILFDTNPERAARNIQEAMRLATNVPMRDRLMQALPDNISPYVNKILPQQAEAQFADSVVDAGNLRQPVDYRKFLSFYYPALDSTTARNRQGE